ncbi:nuclear transport factor 2 family protein [Beggiatoa alba]|nr:nuclear transport factor 2 family protein [Beggiatoa alba]
MNIEFAQNFAEEWVEAWNSHDMNKILSHYASDFEMSSPMIKKIVNEPSGKLKGMNAVRHYWSKALKIYPNLYFEVKAVFASVNSVVVLYKGHGGLSAEVFCFNQKGKVISASAHYDSE